MIHIIIGTKAQLIKMVGIIKDLDRKNIEYNYIDTGQHAEITAKLRKQLDIREPDYKFTNSSKNITSNSQGISWMIKTFFKFIRNKKKVFKGDKGGMVLVHGDTVSTLLGALMGKFGKQKVVHIEAGFRTSNLFKPFPEEIVRRKVDKWSHLNFAFTDAAEEYLKKDNFKGKYFNLKENTLIDAVELAKTQNTNTQLPDNFILVSIHRYETIHSKKRMGFIVNTILDLAKDNKIVWGLHTPTNNTLNNFGLLQKLKENKNIKLRRLFDYFNFINAISRSKFLITDGGGPQDETRYLNIPCLLMRTENERPEHTHIYQSEFKKDRVTHFLKNINDFQAIPVEKTKPSEKIVQILIDEINQNRKNEN